MILTGKDSLTEETVLRCDCSGLDHQVVLTSQKDENLVFLSFQLYAPDLWSRIKYLFKGDFHLGEIVLSKRDMKKVFNKLSK